MIEKYISHNSHGISSFKSSKHVSKKCMAMMLDDVQVAEDIGKIYHQEDTDAVSTVSTIFTNST